MINILFCFLKGRNFKLRVSSQLVFPSFRDPASPIMEGIVNLHNYIFLLILEFAPLLIVQYSYGLIFLN